MPSQMRVAVVGGGPAGSTCAGRLASAGAEVTLFEARPSSEKPCGGGIPARVVEELPELAGGSLPRRVVREAVIYSPGNHRASIPLSGGIHIFRRLELDSFLRRGAEAAGATLRRARVTAVKRAGDVWEVATDQGTLGPFEHLVGADGVRGVVRRSVQAPRFHDGELTLALYAYVPGVARPELMLKFFGGLDGYLWAFPRTDHVSIGICATRRSAEPARLEDELHRFVSAHYPEGRIEPSALKGYFIPASMERSGPLEGAVGTAGERGGWALVGDAAGCADPLTREGISHAMRSAAAVANELATRGRLSTPGTPADLRWAHRRVAGFYREGFLERMIRLASASSAIRKVLADTLEGRQPYPSLKARLLLNALPCGVQVGANAVRTLARSLRSSGDRGGVPSAPRGRRSRTRRSW